MALNAVYAAEQVHSVRQGLPAEHFCTLGMYD
jgi:hypothetical protein